MVVTYNPYKTTQLVPDPATQGRPRPRAISEPQFFFADLRRFENLSLGWRTWVARAPKFRTEIHRTWWLQTLIVKTIGQP